MAGKLKRGKYKYDTLKRMFLQGNAETIYFARDSTTKELKEMLRSLSARIHIRFKDGKVVAMTFASKPEHRYGPLSKFNEDEKTLKGFIWKPKERPVSKESILPSYNKKTSGKTVKGKLPAKGKGTVKGAPGKNQLPKNAGKDTSAVMPGIVCMHSVQDLSERCAIDLITQYFSFKTHRYFYF